MSLQWWWLSFADSAKPRGQQFLGVAIVPGKDLFHALDVARLFGLNPGGEVIAVRRGSPPEEAKYHLLTEEEVKRLFPDAEQTDPIAAEERLRDHYDFSQARRNPYPRPKGRN
jgi:hypothetical protein